MARKPPKGKSLAEVNTELAKQWHSCGSEESVTEEATQTTKMKKIILE